MPHGPLFSKLIEEGKIKTGIEDFEMMYSIIIEERGKSPIEPGEVDEIIALGALCRWPIPWKRRRYRDAVRRIRRQYYGISEDKKKQEEFRKILQLSLKTAKTVNELRFNQRSDIFKYKSMID